jgi:RsiW-degrading membrane proteinase PrsW (M82 family)
MNLTAQQEELIVQKLASLGASGHLLHELTDHWCIQVQLEMKAGSHFTDALDTVSRSQSEKAVVLIAEINQLRFPYVISGRTVFITGVAALLTFVAGILLRLSKQVPPIGMLLPGYILTAYVFLPIWFLRRLYTQPDKVKSTLLFLNLMALTHVVILWLNNARPKMIALLCWIILSIFGLLHYFYYRKIQGKRLGV